jgi:6-phosphogluconolactonase/glucosamine-6-phosphate isomerase/deaminase
MRGMSITTVFESNVALLTQKAAICLQELISQSHNKKVLLLVSGGSAFDVVQALTFRAAQHITLGVIDERFSNEAGDNNFLQLQALPVYAQAIATGATPIVTSLSVGWTRDSLVATMNTAIYEWKEHNPTGKIVALLGIGPDGHTAGMMPFPENEEYAKGLFNNDDVIVVGYDAGDKNPIPERVTTTFPFLRKHVDEAVMYVTGEKKREALTHVLADTGSLFCTPGRIVKEMKSVTLFTDIII